MPKIFSSKAHGYIDYLVGAVLVIAPYLFNFADIGIASFFAQGAGILVLAQSIFTDYELGLFKVIPFRMHLTIDVLASVLLAASPFLFDYNDYPANVWMPHVIAGIAYLLISLSTNSEVGESAERGRIAHS